MAPLSNAGLALSSASQQDLTQRKLAMDALRNRLGDVKSKETQLRESCEGFESVFLQKMWEQMRNNVNKEGYLHSKDEEMYQSMFDVELAKKMASAGGIGLADMLYEQLSAQTSSTGRSTVSAASMLQASGVSGASGAEASRSTQDMLSQAQALPANRQRNEADLTASYLYTAQGTDQAAPVSELTASGQTTSGQTPAGQAPAEYAVPGQPVQGQPNASQHGTQYGAQPGVPPGVPYGAQQNAALTGRPEAQDRQPEGTILAALHDLRMATSVPAPMPTAIPVPGAADPWVFSALNPHAQAAASALPAMPAMPTMTALRPDQIFGVPAQTPDTATKNTGTPAENAVSPETTGLHGTSWSPPSNGPISAQPKPLPLRGNRPSRRTENTPESNPAAPTAQSTFQPSAQATFQPASQSAVQNTSQGTAQHPAFTPEPGSGIPEMVSLGNAPFVASSGHNLSGNDLSANDPSAVPQQAATTRRTDQQTLAQSPFSLTLDEAAASSYGFKRRL